MANGEIVLYTTEDGTASIQLRTKDGTVWLTQAEIAELFQTTPQNITTHLRAIYADNELDEAATCKESLQVQSEGKRTIQRSLKFYNLSVILAIGYRVRSPRGSITMLKAIRLNCFSKKFRIKCSGLRPIKQRPN